MRYARVYREISVLMLESTLYTRHVVRIHSTWTRELAS